MKNSFFKEIIYSSSNEDSESERRALKIIPSDIVLCITGSGARSLDLLVDSPKKIISIDFNETQNHLLELKIAAYRELNYDELISFLGVNPSTERLHVFRKLKSHLSQKALDFWLENLHFVEEGVLYCGKWEKILHSMLRISAFRGKTIKKLMHATSMDEQREIWTKKWDNLIWRSFLKIISNRFLWIYIVREPGAKLISKEFNVYIYMKHRLDHLANNFQIRENHYANLLFNGYYRNSCNLPHHLRRENFEIVKTNIGKIEVVTIGLSEFLQNKKDEISAFSLSDFSSYASEDIYDSIWEKIIYAASDNAKFCERFFLVKKNPEKTFNAISRNHSLEEKLLHEDQTAIYSFCAGTINKTVSKVLNNFK